MEACIRWWKFLVDNDMGGFASTAAAQAMRTYRHKYMQHEIFIDANPAALDMARQAYHGGRTECFTIGKRTGEFLLLDINSQYPYIMTRHPSPIKLIGVTRHATSNDLSCWLRDRSLIVSARITIGEPGIGVMRDGKLIFPIGTFEGTFTTPEIQWVLHHGRIDRIYEVAIYDHALAFGAYMIDMYSRRMQCKREGNAVEVEFYKKFMQSFYGKWGQRGYRWDNVTHVDDLNPRHWIEIDYDEKKVVSYRQFSGVIQKKIEEGECLNSHPAIAAHVTAFGRMCLWDIIERAGSGHVYYCDTDSVLVDRQGADNLGYVWDSDELGGLKCEGRYTDIEIWGPKDYVFDNKVKIKGIRKNALLLKPEEYQNDPELLKRIRKAHLDSVPVVFSQDKWSGLRGMLRTGQFDAPTTRKVKKFLRRQYDKAIVQPDGSVRPFLLSL
jgi:hypothetical protein